MTRAVVLGSGWHAPDRRVTSADIENRLALPAGWIASRTGIIERRYAAPDEATSDLAIAAGASALARSGVPANQIGLVLLATSTPDHPLPGTAPLVAHRLGCHGVGAMDIAGACSGFLYALGIAEPWVRMHTQPVLVIAANVLSRRLNDADPASSVLFSDGAGAVVLGPSDDDTSGVRATHLSAAGEHYDLIKVEAGGSRQPVRPETTVADRSIRLSDGRAAFQIAVEAMVEAGRAALALAKCDLADVDWWIPHQANARIIEVARLRLGIDTDRTALSIADLGNSSAASIAVTYARLVERGAIRGGQLVLMTAVGAGFTSGGVVFKAT